MDFDFVNNLSTADLEKLANEIKCRQNAINVYKNEGFRCSPEFKELFEKYKSLVENFNKLNQCHTVTVNCSVELTIHPEFNDLRKYIGLRQIFEEESSAAEVTFTLLKSKGLTEPQRHTLKRLFNTIVTDEVDTAVFCLNPKLQKNIIELEEQALQLSKCFADCEADVDGGWLEEALKDEYAKSQK